MTWEVIAKLQAAAKNPFHRNTDARKEPVMNDIATIPTARLESLVDTHLAAYCEPDAQRRLAQIRSVWALEGHLVDPPFASRGHAGISEQAAALLGQFPGHRFERSTAIDAHHTTLRYGWRLVDGEGAPVMEGVDVLDLDVDGRISRVVGFFGAQPAALAAGGPNGSAALPQ
jgi:hypothetical protein